MHNSPTPRLLRWWRMARVGVLFLRGALTVLFVYPWSGDTRRMALKQRWSADILKVLSIRLEAELSQMPMGSMVVANHTSWLDIFIINAAFPAAFVSKAEVRQWPLIGWLAAVNDTVFLQRGSRGHARQINQDIGGKLAAGKQVAVFPEGTTTDGTHVLHFHGALLQPALEAGRPITPLALAYLDTEGQLSKATRYDGDVSIGESLASILACRELTARLQACTPLLPEEGSRKELAQRARAAIQSHIDTWLASSASSDLEGQGLSSTAIHLEHGPVFEAHGTQMAAPETA